MRRTTMTITFDSPTAQLTFLIPNFAKKSGAAMTVCPCDKGTLPRGPPWPQEDDKYWGRGIVEAGVAF